MAHQKYENYWKLTVEYTDIHSSKFRETLKIIIDFIDENKGGYSKELYEKLQQRVFAEFPKADLGSVRKSINQFVKLGFVNFELRSYHNNSKDFLNATSKRVRKHLFSIIFYTNASFDRSVTNQSEKREINFLIKTLEANGTLTKKEIEALMLIDIESIKEGYASKKLIDEFLNIAKGIDFKDRKYNQVGYLYNFLNKLDDIVFIKDILYFKQDAISIDDRDSTKKRVRDQYLHRLYKYQLKQESSEVFNKAVCMVEKLDYPVLIASHIKPFVSCNDREAYDVDNGILLSKNIDSLFDLGYITFDNKGIIICSQSVSGDVNIHLQQFKLNDLFLTNKRLQYLDYHRNCVFRK